MYDVTADDWTPHPSGSDAPFDVSYHKCPSGTALSTWSLIYGTISGNNWDRIDMHSADGCMTLTRLRTPGAQL
ncbi:uncharacterized protein ACA1_320310 [Acanthamoeba castellanii str. Neff]|uniref:Uncharacterized protein n=1 Tax=Acanthamoeba castellanii (strain ATCC 30010 / Neff) TaxID=1257118 RepID=L8H4X3_ACACF|nr:uncharacterized protein ACA1_320310 [Acanthamoeba castellanii str. Neff]ELR20277.1 hypothetical protein ACA1_320310 [Acanthamoeba castellanii str. Neff]